MSGARLLRCLRNCDAHLLEREELASALLSRRGQPVQQLDPQLCVWVLLGWRGDDILHICGVSVVQLRMT
jgi:hypothetical protein